MSFGVRELAPALAEASLLAGDWTAACSLRLR